MVSSNPRGAELLGGYEKTAMTLGTSRRECKNMNKVSGAEVLLR